MVFHVFARVVDDDDVCGRDVVVVNLIVMAFFFFFPLFVWGGNPSWAVLVCLDDFCVPSHQRKNRQHPYSSFQIIPSSRGIP